MAILLASCGGSTDKNKPENDVSSHAEEATHFYEEAIQLHAEFTTERDTVLKAIALLDSAILLAPDSTGPYFLKHAYHLRLGEYEQALNTLKIIESTKPDNVDLKSSIAVCYLLNNKEDSAQLKLLEADKLWSMVLDTITPGNTTDLLHIAMNKGAVHILLGNKPEAEITFNKIRSNPAFQEEQYEGMMNDIDSLFLNQTQESFYNYLISQIKQNQLP